MGLSFSFTDVPKAMTYLWANFPLPKGKIVPKGTDYNSDVCKIVHFLILYRWKFKRGKSNLWKNPRNSSLEEYILLAQLQNLSTISQFINFRERGKKKKILE